MQKSKAKTAYGLLGDVARHILAQPQTYDQDTFADESETCGTVACRAGWIVALGTGCSLLNVCGIEDRANDLLGMQNDDYENATSFRTAADELYSEKSVPSSYRKGSKRYAWAGASGILKFRATHRARLLSTRLPGR